MLYSPNPASRPNTPVNIVIGALILKEMFRLTDEELMERMMFDVLFQHALGTTSYEEQPVSDRTFSRFRERLYHYELATGRDLVREEMENLVEAFRDFSGVSDSIRRMDSVMVASSCKRMSRLEILYTCVAKMVRRMNEEDVSLPEHLRHYLKESDANQVLYHRRNEELADRLQAVIEDGVSLVASVPEALIDSQEMRLLQRVLREQVEETPEGPRPKAKESITTDSLQNPSDPDATYRKKAGKDHKGYTANIVETCPEEGPSFITHYDLKPNTYSDQAFARDLLEILGEREEPLTLIADGAYGSEEIKAQAKKQNIDLITTTLIGKSPHPVKADFHLDTESKQVLRCPGGKAPRHTSYYPDTGTYRAVFERSSCQGCPHRETCGMKAQKKSNVVLITEAMIARAKTVLEMGTELFKEYSKKRNGVEGMPSVFRRRYGIDGVPVRGRVRLKTWFGLKVGAVNAKRLIKNIQMSFLYA